MSITDVVVDIETLGTRPGDSIVQIAVVGFDRNREHYDGELLISVSVPLAKSEANATADTLAWWFLQNEEAKNCLLHGNQVSSRVVDGEVQMLAVFMMAAEEEPIKSCKWWGNSHSFDLVLLEAALSKVYKAGKPWDFRKERCYRTLEAETPKCFVRERTTATHVAVNDAMYEAECLYYLLRSIPKDS